MRVSGERRIAIALVALVVALASLPGAGLADDDEGDDGPDLTIEYLGWDPVRPGLITFVVTNVGNADSAATTGKGERIAPPDAPDTAPPIPALAPQASVEVHYLVSPAERCDNDRVRMSVPLADDANPDDNTLAVQLCDTDAGADLALEYLGIDPTDERFVKFTVANVGKDRTEATTGHVETLAPPPVREAPLTVPALDPGASHEVRYQLSRLGCDNHTVKANVPLAADRFPIDNTRTVQVCGPKPPPPADDGAVVVGPAPRSVPPEHLRPGTHTETFTPVATRPVLTRRPEVPPNCRVTFQDARPSTVGFQNSFFSGCTWHEIRQIAFKFDFSKLRGHSHLPISAELRYRETVYHERAPNGGLVPHPREFQISCSLQLGRPTVDWGARSGRIPYSDAREQNRIGLFNQFLEWVPPMVHNLVDEAHGLILVGPNEKMEADNAACMSVIGGIELSYTYVIEGAR